MATRRLVTVFAMILSAVSVLAAQPGQGEFVPIEQLPPTEQLPAAPLLIAAYAFVWVATAGYLWMVWRRLGKVEREMQDLERRRSVRGAR